MDVSKILEEAGIRGVIALQDGFDRKGLNHTNKAKESISYKVEGKTLIFYGLGRVVFLEFGRKNGKFPPYEDLIPWVEEKLGVSKEESKSVAFLVARKIAREGTDIFKDNAKGLQIAVTLDMMNKELLTDITNSLSISITDGLIKTWLD